MFNTLLINQSLFFISVSVCFLVQLIKNSKYIPTFFKRLGLLIRNRHVPPGGMNFYNFIICVLVFSEKLQMSLSSKVENYFLFVQSGVTQSNACILKELPVNNSTISALLQCSLHCNALSQCVGMDIIGNEAKRCRLFSDFPDLIPAYATSADTVRYKKVLNVIHLYGLNAIISFFWFLLLYLMVFLMRFFVVGWNQYW